MQKLMNFVFNKKFLILTDLKIDSNISIQIQKLKMNFRIIK